MARKLKLKSSLCDSSLKKKKAKIIQHKAKADEKSSPHKEEELIKATEYGHKTAKEKNTKLYYTER